MIYFKNTSTNSQVTLKTTEGFVCVRPNEVVCIKGKLITKPHSLLQQITESEYNEIKKDTKVVNKDNADKKVADKKNKNKSTKNSKHKQAVKTTIEEHVETVEEPEVVAESDSLKVEEVEENLVETDLELLKKAWFETDDLSEKEKLQKEIKRLEEEIEKQTKE